MGIARQQRFLGARAQLRSQVVQLVHAYLDNLLFRHGESDGDVRKILGEFASSLC